MRSLLVLAAAACSSPPPSPPAPAPVATGVADGELDAPPSKDGSIGTAHPTTIDKIADDGRWVVICQARRDTNRDGKIWAGVAMHGATRGDRLEPYLVLGSGAGIAIDSFVSASADGRWVAVIRERKLELVDVAARRRTVLADADLREDDAELGPRAASIAANGSRMVYLRHDRDRDRIAVRELASGQMHAIDVDGVLWRVAVDAAGYWAKVSVMRADTDGDGATGWPVARTNLAPPRCRGPVRSFTSGSPGGDEPTERWLDLETGAFVDDPTVIGPLGPQLLRAGADGSLQLDRETIAPASCRAEIHAATIQPPHLLVTCETGVTPSELRWLGPGGVSEATGIKAAHRGGGGRELPVLRGRAWCGEQCIDVWTGATFALPPGTIEASDSEYIVIRSGKTRVVFDATTRKTRPLPGTGALGALDDGVIAIGDAIYSLATAQRIGARDDEIVTTAHGRLLLGNPGTLDCASDPAGLPYSCGSPAAGGALPLPLGPLRWSP